MKKLLISFTLFLIYSCSVNVSNMLNKALKGVVVVVGELEYQSPFGFTFFPELPEAYRWKVPKSVGSGFVVTINNKNYVLTNAHVIDNLERQKGRYLTVYSHNGSKMKCEVIGGDSFYDIGILEIKDVGGADIVPLNFRKKPLKIGEEVYAIGHPLTDESDLQYTITKGIVSGLNRVSKSYLPPFGLIQHTAFVFYGNSGGPLLDLYGNVVGVNCQIFLTNRLDFSQLLPVYYINYSIDGELFIKFVEEIIREGRIKRSFLGLEFKIHKKNSEKNKITINDILEGSVFQNQLQIGDVVLKINNQNVENFKDLIFELERSKENQNFSITVARKGRIITMEVISEKITDQAYERIAKFVLKKYASDLAFEEVEDGRLTVYSKKREKTKITNAFYGSIIWSVKNLKDLGLVFKLLYLYGSVELLSEGKENITISFIKDDDDYNLLIY